MATTTFNDIIFGQTVLQQLTEILTPLNAFATDISGDVKDQGATVVVPLYGNMTTTTFSQSTTAMEPSTTTATVSAVTVNLSSRKITPLNLTVQQVAESSAAKYERWGAQMVNSMAQTILGEVWSLITTTAFGEAIITTTSTNHALASLITARQSLLGAGVRGPKSFVINLAGEGALLGDTKLVAVSNRGDNQAIKKGTIGEIMGLQVYSSDIIPTNSISLTGFACGQDAIVFAMRNLGEYLPSGEFEAMQQLTDPESGISVLYTRHWSRASGSWWVNLHALYGYSVAVTLALKPFRTATT